MFCFSFTQYYCMQWCTSSLHPVKQWCTSLLHAVMHILNTPFSSSYFHHDIFILTLSLKLKKVRLRTTFASADTSYSTVQLSCCEHYGNVLNEYSGPELKAVSSHSEGRRHTCTHVHRQCLCSCCDFYYIPVVSFLSNWEVTSGNHIPRGKTVPQDWQSSIPCSKHLY